MTLNKYQTHLWHMLNHFEAIDCDFMAMIIRAELFESILTLGSYQND